MNQQALSYDACVNTSERVAWTVEGVFNGRAPNMSKPMLHESLACVQEISFLNETEKLWLNQIRAHSYAHLIYFIEEAIVHAILGQIQSSRSGDQGRLRALLRFADEEIKHQQLFLKFCDLFVERFGPCGILSSRATAQDVALTLNKNQPLAVLLVLLHIEWVSQRHFVECFRDAGTSLDALFCDLLKFHWMEEATHTKIDQMLIETIVAQAQPKDIAESIDVYLELGKAIDGLLYQQIELDVASLERKAGRVFPTHQRDELLVVQATACRRSLLWMGMTNPPFVDYLRKLSVPGQEKVAEVAAMMA